MSLETDRQAFEIYHMVINDKKYSDVMANYIKRFDELIIQSKELPDEQWKAIHNYLDAMNQFYSTMLTIALEGNK